LKTVAFETAFSKKTYFFISKGARGKGKKTATETPRTKDPYANAPRKKANPQPKGGAGGTGSKKHDDADQKNNLPLPQA